MGRGPTLSGEKRAQIIALRDAGFSQRRIARQLQCSKTAVYEAIRRFEQTGSHADRPRTGQPRATTPQDDAYLRLTARRRRKVTARTLHGEWVPVIGRQVSIQTVRNRLVAGVINCIIPNNV